MSRLNFAGDSTVFSNSKLFTLSELFKYSPYKSLNEDQYNSVQEIIQSLSEKKTTQIFIEGSAGTGKTFTLALLVIRMVLDKKLLISQVVAVTFTNAATGELKERVGRFFTQAREYLSEIVPEDEIDNAPLIAYLKKFKVHILKHL